MSTRGHDGIPGGGRITLADALGYWPPRSSVASPVPPGSSACSTCRPVSGQPGSRRRRVRDLINDRRQGGGAFIAEIVLTFVFVFVILAVTRRASNATVAGLVIGLALTLVHIIGIRSTDLGQPGPEHRPGPVRRRLSAQPALGVHPGPAHRGVVSALVFQFLYPQGEQEASVGPAPQEQAH